MTLWPLILLQPIISKLFKKVILRRMKKIIKKNILYLILIIIMISEIHTLQLIKLKSYQNYQKITNIQRIWNRIFEQFFRINQGNALSDLEKLQSGMPQRSVLRLILYLLGTSNLLTFNQNVEAQFVDDTAILDFVESTREP